MKRYIRFAVYKMVRDFVVPLCRQQGCRVNAHTMTLEESLAESRRKVLEEASEVVKADSRTEMIKELADLADAMDKFMAVRNITAAELLAARQQKQAEKGPFEDDIYLSEMDVPIEHPDLPNFLAAPDKYINMGQVTENDPAP